MAYLHAFGSRFWIAAICNLRNSLAHTGILVAAIAKSITVNINKLNASKYIDKIGVTDEETGSSVEFLGKLVFLIVFLSFCPACWTSWACRMYLHRSHPWYPSSWALFPICSQPWLFW